ncbi:MAG: SusC/RagA family TonB-linked outer membrane protein [Longimicrobiales bacterium]
MRRAIVIVLATAFFQALVWSAALAQEAGRITGTVADDAGQPLPGASVTVDGTGRSAISGQNGAFVVTGVPAGTHQLSVSLLGYATVTRADITVTAGQAVTVDIVLASEAIALTEIVAVGYGEQRRVNLTGAVASVSQAQLADRPVARITEALQGSTPGLTIIQRSAQPGRQGIDFNIRGRNSINTSTTPLILIDEVPGDINQISVEDIESISVLKDASSVAIYGARGANGVILITTRRGANSGSIRLSYDGYYGFQEVAKFPEAVGPREYLEMINEALANKGLPPDYSEEYIENSVRAYNGDGSVDRIMYPWTDWLDVIFDPAPIQEHTIGVSGGNELLRFSGSVNYLDQQGTSPQVDADRIGVRLNTDVNVSDRLTTAFDLAVRRSTDAEPREQGDVLFRMFHDTPPTVMPRYPDGTYGHSQNNRNPLLTAEATGRRDRSFLNGTVTARTDYRLFDSFTLRGQASVVAENRDDTTWRPQTAFRDFFTGDVWRSDSRNRVDRFKREDREVTLRAMGVFDRSFGVHGVSATFGYEQTAWDRNEISAFREDSYSNDLKEITSGSTTFEGTNGTSSAWRLRSGFGRVSYNLMDRYLVEANLRYDGSSRFATGNRFGWFPSFSAGWRVSEESFFRDNVSFVDELKLRVSWGRTGNNNIGNYEYWQTVSLNSGNYPLGGSELATGAAKTGLANPDISWETTTMRNVGLDITLLDGRLSFTGDFYNNLTDGLLLDRVIPRTLGLGNDVRENAGKIENVGYELAVNWRDRIGQLDYSVGFNLSDNRNKVLDLGGNPPIIDGRWYTAEGYPLGTMWGLQALGLFRDQADVDSHADQTGLDPNFGPGDIKFADLNGDGVITLDGDRTAIGNDLPRYLIGSNLSLGYKGFDANIFVQSVLKNQVYFEGALSEGPVWRNFTTVEWLDRWTEEDPNPNAKRPKPTLEGHWNHGQVSSFWVEDASYLKLKTASIGYTFRPGSSGSVLPFVGVTQMRLYVSGQNLLTFGADNLFLDPEFLSGRGTVYPVVRTISVGTSVQF